MIETPSDEQCDQIADPTQLVLATVPSEHLTLIGCVKPDGTPVTIADV